MTSFKQLAAKAVVTLAACGGVFGAISLAAPSEAKADPYHYHYTPHVHVQQYYAPHVQVPHYHAPQYVVPQYHAPSVHYHRSYHHDYDHWTPHQGLHSHGHYDYTPHYTPGHLHW
jgi:hypothetical protein